MTQTTTQNLEEKTYVVRFKKIRFTFIPDPEQGRGKYCERKQDRYLENVVMTQTANTWIEARVKSIKKLATEYKFRPRDWQFENTHEMKANEDIKETNLYEFIPPRDFVYA